MKIDDVKATVDGVDFYARTLEEKWGVERLRLLVDADLRAKFDAQRQLFNDALFGNKAKPIIEHAEAMMRGWRVLDEAARDLNSNGSLFGSRGLEWIDEEAFIFTSCQLESDSVVTRSMSEINFLATARQGDIIEVGMEAIDYGRTSLTISCVVRNMRTKQIITPVEKLVFVKVDENGRPIPHYKVHPIDREFTHEDALAVDK